MEDKNKDFHWMNIEKWVEEERKERIGKGVVIVAGIDPTIDYKSSITFENFEMFVQSMTEHVRNPKMLEDGIWEYDIKRLEYKKELIPPKEKPYSPLPFGQKHLHFENSVKSKQTRLKKKRQRKKKRK